MEKIQIDLLTVLIAAVLNMFIGMAWYSSWLFGPSWMELRKISKLKAEQGRLSIVFSFIASLLTAYILANFEGYLGVTRVLDGMFVGFCIWLGFIATTQISSVIWGETPFKLFLIDTGFKLLTFLVMGGVIGA